MNWIPLTDKDGQAQAYPPQPISGTADYYRRKVRAKITTFPMAAASSSAPTG